jgi:hypothetical protein
VSGHIRRDFSDYFRGRFMAGSSCSITYVFGRGQRREEFRHQGYGQSWFAEWGALGWNVGSYAAASRMLWLLHVNSLIY